MVARLLKLLWIALLLAAAGAAWTSIHFLGSRVGPWAAGLLAVFVVAALHPAAIAAQFIGSRVAGDAVPESFRLSWWQAVKTYDAEIDASMRGLWFATPFLAHRVAAKPSPDIALRALPILFIHGYLCNRAVWLSFIEDAAARGYLCEAVTLPNPFAPIETQLPTIDRAIDDLLATARAAGLDASRVAIVAHSMGGLVARSAIAHLDASRIGPVVTLGTPHHGTLTARFGSIPSIVQMRPGSPWLAELATHESVTKDRSFTSIFSYHDDIVYPQTTGALEGTRQFAIGGCGHVALLYDKRVRIIVFDSLAPIQAASEGLAAS